MGWRRGRPVDALTAPAEKNIKTGPTELDSAAARIAAPADLECRSIGFVPAPGNAGTVYIGGLDVSSASGLPVPDTGIALDINHVKNPAYGIADTSGDAVRWISIL